MAITKVPEDEEKTTATKSLRKNSDSDSLFSSSSNIGVVAKALGAKYGKKHQASPLMTGKTC